MQFRVRYWFSVSFLFCNRQRREDGVLPEAAVAKRREFLWGFDRRLENWPKISERI